MSLKKAGDGMSTFDRRPTRSMLFLDLFTCDHDGGSAALLLLRSSDDAVVASRYKTGESPAAAVTRCCCRASEPEHQEKKMKQGRKVGRALALSLASRFLHQKKKKKASNAPSSCSMHP